MAAGLNSFVVSDELGELLAMTSELLKKLGKIVKILRQNAYICFKSDVHLKPACPASANPNAQKIS